jgi:hypothetical protein
MRTGKQNQLRVERISQLGNLLYPDHRFGPSDARLSAAFGSLKKLKKGIEGR